MALGRKKLLRLLAELVLVAVAFFGVRAWQQRGLATGNARELTGPSLDGGTLSLASLQGKPALVHFWATWCGVCEQQAGNISELAKGGHQVLTVASDSGGVQEVQKYLATRGLSFPVLLDPQGQLARSWGVSAFPTDVVVDAKGRIRFNEVGYTTTPGLRARLWWAAR